MTAKVSNGDATPKSDGRRRKKDLPSVQYLLRHGDPETAHLPKTWAEIIGYPFALAMVFAASLLIFHHTVKYLPPPAKQDLPNIKKMRMFQRKQEQPHANAGIPNLDDAENEL
mmetsp:Transcript_6536/g.16124  ORF Transcript_6536/g.16124 Transcript_6536/m.16124 type:complete len:113 (+) Transcript_6536:162-500(+)|eukprot:CAMPEP_0197185434 /NCGR_PEP_ID=MMETSP1423-20130617/11909_1 /TAXON_ID=476441 /ORGANISM="Pseudo-nitzschia heimii, Strain UNC1101" /LENGTH=112 /DNA_ID=CAMNT_0042636489 /DNA_START=107 /DNA_END=445 /DNA_ORIENTATION=+